MWKSIVIDGETHHVDTCLLTQQLLVAPSLKTDSETFPHSFHYELSTIPPSLFHPQTHSMRKANKSSLVKALDDMTVNSNPIKHEDAFYVIDGGALLHTLPWPKKWIQLQKLQGLMKII